MKTSSKGYKAYPEWNYVVKIPMFHDSENPYAHVCHICRPDFFASLPPGFVTCARCGDVIHTGDEEDLRNEAMACCERCEEEMVNG